MYGVSSNMEIEVIETEDGGLTLSIECDDATRDILAGQGILRLIEEGIRGMEEDEKERGIDESPCGSVS